MGRSSWCLRSCGTTTRSSSSSPSRLLRPAKIVHLRSTKAIFAFGITDVLGGKPPRSFLADDCPTWHSTKPSHAADVGVLRHPLRVDVAPLRTRGIGSFLADDCLASRRFTSLLMQQPSASSVIACASTWPSCMHEASAPSAFLLISSGRSISA
ncbi:hypothetical protein Taro_037589 [Colocasia esculenta]|uniref:Uncharacterized protein n=1 Tax=Colocasia esculenta TaxID=4460 RepID=A0A843WL77_COLES|nr:hypothetical protein [Colocasia esculenta]